MLGQWAEELETRFGLRFAIFEAMHGEEGAADGGAGAGRAAASEGAARGLSRRRFEISWTPRFPTVPAGCSPIAVRKS
jgi:hypothetical protein